MVACFCCCLLLFVAMLFCLCLLGFGLWFAFRFGCFDYFTFLFLGLCLLISFVGICWVVYCALLAFACLRVCLSVINFLDFCVLRLRWFSFVLICCLIAICLDVVIAIRFVLFY